MLLIQKVLDWLAVKDYDAAKRKAAAETAARYARGNVSVQNGWFLNKEKLDEQSVAADKNMRVIRKKIAAL